MEMALQRARRECHTCTSKQVRFAAMWATQRGDFKRHHLLIGGGNVRTEQRFDIVMTEREHKLVLSAVK